MSEPTVRSIERDELLVAETSEGEQELQRRENTKTNELGREIGAVLRSNDLHSTRSRSTSSAATTRP
jgi:hypothetical protein